MKEFIKEWPITTVYAVSILLLAICTLHPIAFLAVIGAGGIIWAASVAFDGAGR